MCIMREKDSIFLPSTLTSAALVLNAVTCRKIPNCTIIIFLIRNLCLKLFGPPNWCFSIYVVLKRHSDPCPECVHPTLNLETGLTPIARSPLLFRVFASAIIRVPSFFVMCSLRTRHVLVARDQRYMTCRNKLIQISTNIISSNLFISEAQNLGPLIKRFWNIFFQ